MATDYSEKRNFYRMSVESQLEYNEVGNQETRIGYVKNLSGDGLLFYSDHAITIGAELEITVNPGSSMTQPLQARVEVVRCDITDDADIFAIAATMKDA